MRRFGWQIRCALRPLMVVGLGGALVLPLTAGESVRFTDAPDPSPGRSRIEPQRSVVGEGGRGMAPNGDFGSERGVTSPNVPLPPPYLAAPTLTPKERDALERRRNWIFQTMESAGSGPGGVEDAFGVESYRLDKDWVGSHRASTSMTRFIEREPVAREMPREEDNAEEESNSGNRESEGSYARQLRARNWDAFAVNPGGLDRTLPGRERLPEAGNSGSLSGVDESSISERDAAERPSLRPRFGTGVGMEAAGRDSSWRFRSGERLTARDFATPSDAALSASKESGSGDPVNLFPDLTRQALNPVTASSVVPGGPMSRPIGPLDAEVGRPANRLRSRFSDSTGTGLGEGPAAASVAETQVGTSSKVFKSRVLLEMPTRRF